MLKSILSKELVRSSVVKRRTDFTGYHVCVSMENFFASIHRMASSKERRAKTIKVA